MTAIIYKKNPFLFLLSGLFCLSILITGCLDSITFEQPETISDGLAIQGKLVKGSPSFINVTLKQVLDFNSAPRLINARAVTLFDESGNSIALDTRAEGIFFKTIPDNDPDITIDFGKSYRIRVETFDNRTFESATESILPAPTPTSLKAERIEKAALNAVGDLVTRDDFIGFSIDTPLEISPGSGNVRLIWELEGIYQLTDTPETHGSRACRGTRIDELNKSCFISVSPSTNFIPLDGTELSVNSITDFMLYDIPISPILSEGYYLRVFQQSVTDDAFEYWSQVNQVAARTGSLFEAPAGRVKSNITNVNDPEEETFGYFYATEEREIRVFVDPSLAGNPALTCPGALNQGGAAPSNCCDCLTVANSSTERPSWW